MTSTVPRITLTKMIAWRHKESLLLPHAAGRTSVLPQEPCNIGFVTSSLTAIHPGLIRDVFSNPESEESKITLDLLMRNGFENPFAITSEIKDHEDDVFKNNGEPDSELGRAILLFRSIIEEQAFFKVNNIYFQGLEMKQGGLNIVYNEDLRSPLRSKHGDLQPTELILADPKERVAVCIEFSHLLTVLLRSAGIKAFVGREGDHAFVIAELDRKYYRLDPARLKFQREYNPKCLSDSQSVSIHYSNEGIARYEQGDIKEAIRCLRIAVQIDDENARAWNSLGNALLATNDNENLDEAYAGFNKAISLDGSFPEPFINKGIVLMLKGRIDDAIKLFEIAIRINPLSVNAWFQKGKAIYKKGDIDAAIECFRQAVSLAPNDNCSLAYLGMILLDRGKRADLKEALFCLEIAQTGDPDDIFILSNLARALIIKGDKVSLANAVMCLEKILRTNPQDQYAAKLLREALQKKEKSEQKLHQRVIRQLSTAFSFLVKLTFGRIRRALGSPRPELAD